MPASQWILSTLTISTLIVVIIVTCCKTQPRPPIEAPPTSKVIPVPRTPPATTTTNTRSLWTWSKEEEMVLLDQIRAKLKPHSLLADDDKVLEPHQFLHLHHMKTGGTSIDHLLKCARERLTKDLGYQLKHFSIHECARSQFRHCVQNASDPCRQDIQEATTMSFCSALKHLYRLGWDDTNRIKAFTVLRNPVDRVWSMYRFQTKMCYNCKNLTDIYELIDTDKTLGYDTLCLAQLQNHETANLLSSDWPANATDDEIVAEAIENMKSFFTVIGLTEELTLSTEILGTTFPWINKTVEGSMERCSLPHDNSAPINNHCILTPRTDGGAGYISSHMYVPDHPDEATRKAIEAHNQLDMRVYAAAVQYFKLQKLAFEANTAGAERL